MNPGNRAYRSSETTRRSMKTKRDVLREANLCINSATHGPATHGVLCESCRTLHRGTQRPGKRKPRVVVRMPASIADGLPVPIATFYF